MRLFSVLFGSGLFFGIILVIPLHLRLTSVRLLSYTDLVFLRIREFGIWIIGRFLAGFLAFRVYILAVRSLLASS